MENKTEKMHLMISSAPSEFNAMSVYDNTIQKYNFKSIQTVKQAMDNKAPALVSMKAKNKELAENVLKLMFAKTARAFNITRNIEPGQIVELVDAIMTDYYYLKLSEVFYILKQAKLGKFGKTYERIDEPTILGWFNTYVEERDAIAIEKSLSQHDQYTHSEKDRQYEGFFEKAMIEKHKEQDKVFQAARKLANKMVASANERANKIQELNNDNHSDYNNNNNDNNEPRAME